MPTIQTRDGHTCHYFDAGSGAPVVLLHGSASAGAAWAAVKAHLLRDHRTLAPDLRGYGQSEPWPRGEALTPETDLLAVEAMFDIAGEPVHLVGHSAGAVIALRAAIRHPKRIASLSLIEPVAFHLLRQHQDRDQDRELWAEIEMLARRHIDFVGQNRDEDAAAAFVAYWSGPHVWRDLAVPMRKIIIESMPRVAAEWRLMLDAPEIVARIGEINVPTQLFLGTHTTPATKRVMAHLRETFPRAAYVELEGAGHLSLHSHAAVLAEHVRRFVRQIAGYHGRAA
ncbi:MAG: alpha/beta fold hydrolase [Alphaproteobacteria bacterium]